MISNLFKGNNIRSHVTRFIILLLACFSIVYLSMLYSTVSVNTQSGEMFKINQELEELNILLVKTSIDVETYLDSKDSDAFIRYLDKKIEIENFISKYNNGYNYDMTYLKLNNICNMLKKFTEKSDTAIEFKRARFTSRYIQAFEETEEIYLIIKNEIREIKLLELNSNLSNYKNLEQSVSRLTLIFLGLSSILIIMSLIFIYNFTDRIIHPIEDLSEHSKKVSMGQYDSLQVEEAYFDEASVLTSSMNEMTSNIKSYIDELHDKANTETKLRNAQIKNLKIENLLKQAELTALQSQINPHFLFNCLNAGVGLAGLEDAERTSEYLDNLSQLFRYNLSGLEQIVTLKDEVNNVANYFELMKVRFSDRVEYVFDIDQNALGVNMPPLILQPLVENSFIHGFEEKEQNCLLKLSIKKEGNHTLIELFDNGKGISEERLMKINKEYFSDDKIESVNEHMGHTTGLGVTNVYQRLKLFYNSDDIIEIKSKEGEWTLVTIKLLNEVNYV